jgi:hypothetical protein
MAALAPGSSQAESGANEGGRAVRKGQLEIYFKADSF